MLKLSMSIRPICTKASYLPVFYLELCRRTRIRCVLIITLCASVVPGIEICLHGANAFTPRLILLFGVLYYVFWRVGYKGLKKFAERSVDEIWKTFPSPTLRLDINEDGLFVVFDGVDVSPVNVKLSVITRIETLNGCTAIFSNDGNRINSLLFVATEDVTEELKRCLKQRIIARGLER